MCTIPVSGYLLTRAEGSGGNVTIQPVSIEGRTYWVRSLSIRVHGLEWWSADVYDSELLAIAKSIGTTDAIEMAHVAGSRAATEGSAIAQAVHIARRNKN